MRSLVRGSLCSMQLSLREIIDKVSYQALQYVVFNTMPHAQNQTGPLLDIRSEPLKKHGQRKRSAPESNQHTQVIRVMHHQHKGDKDQQRGSEHDPLLLLQQEAALVDVGGEVEPRQTCPHLHLASHLHISPDDLASSVTPGRCMTCGSEVEPWVCLGCKCAVHCSRYVNADAEAHFFASLTAEREERWRDVVTGESSGEGRGGRRLNTATGMPFPNGGGRSRQEEGKGHGLVLSLSDLSVWCYLCSSYVKHDRLVPFLVRAEALKFNTPDKTALLAGIQTRFQTGLVLPNGMDDAEEEKGVADIKPTPAQCVFEHLKACSLLAKTVRVRSVAEAQARGDLRSVLVLSEGEADGEEEGEIIEMGMGGEIMVMPSEKEEVREALAAGKELVVVRVGLGGIAAGPQDVEVMLRQMLEAT